MPLVATAVVWMRLLNPETGPINESLAAVGIEGPLWLASPQWALASLVFVSMWGVGSPMVIFLAGLQEIPESLYEAARIDGANAARRFRHVTLPGLSPVILFNVVMAIINGRRYSRCRTFCGTRIRDPSEPAIFIRPICMTTRFAF